ncbi:hypothetical protein BSL78_02072 [Apostichopus japonicus]|uniref:Uncharacterized protein n=1 Tax=Stichopus japonicus TaxID=307972 RepID=A0A2G8LL88_STIJA|nr:hypothetical protein BSL78_02072 [Apostichopus japonicus]
MMHRLVFLRQLRGKSWNTFASAICVPLQELKTFSAVTEKRGMKFDGFQGAGGAIGTLLNCDVALFEAQMLEDIPVFTGSSLIILDMPEDWMCAEVKSFINHVTSVNINHRIEDFTFIILSPVREMATLQQAIRESRHFNEPMSVFYMINNQTPSNDGKLVDCVGGATIAQKGLDVSGSQRRRKCCCSGERCDDDRTLKIEMSKEVTQAKERKMHHKKRVMKRMMKRKKMMMMMMKRL